MQIDVSQLLKAPVGETRDYQITEIVNIDDSESAVQGEVNLTHTNRGILVKGTLWSTVELTCSRCLRLYRCRLTQSIEEEYLATTDVVTGAALPVPEESDHFLIGKDYVLDLSEAMKQYILLAIPMKPLCREDCAGLCPKCGHKLNEGACGCPQEIDPRWSELYKLTHVDINA